MRSDRLALALCALLLGCRASPYRCDATHACNAGSVCAADGFCAEPVSPAECASGLRYSESAERPNACATVSDAGADAGADAAMTDVSAEDVALDDLADTTDLAPDGAPSDAPVDASPDALADVTADSPADTITDAPADVRADAPADVPVDVPTCAALLRLVAPLHGTRLGGNRADLAVDYNSARGSAGAEIEVSQDRAFSDAVTLSVVGDDPVVSARTAALPRGTWFWRGRIRCSNGALGPWSARWMFRLSGIGRTTNSPLGWVPDMNGDGYGDLAVGNPTTGPTTLRTPSVDVIRGGLHATPARTSDTWTIEAPSGDLTAFGSQVAVVPDMNGDGLSDLVVGTCLRAPAACQSTVIVYGGTRSGEPVELHRVAFPRTPTSLTRFGVTLAGVGDLDRDGYGDLAIGDPGDFERGFGRVYLWFGGTSTFRLSAPLEMTSTTSAKSMLTLFGWRVAGPGDVDADGTADVLVTSFQNAWVLRGVATGVFPPLIPVAGYNAIAEGTYGFNASGAGDLNGDGVADFALGRAGIRRLVGDVGLFFGTGAGLWSAPSSLVSGPTDSDLFGTTFAGGGDVNADGYDDMLLSARGASLGAGTAYLIAGMSSGTLTPLPTLSSMVGDFGRSLAFMGDFDGDGLDDLAVGAGGGAALGTVYTYRAGAPAAPFVSPWSALTNGLSTDYGAALSGR